MENFEVVGIFREVRFGGGRRGRRHVALRINVDHYVVAMAIRRDVSTVIMQIRYIVAMEARRGRVCFSDNSCVGGAGGGLKPFTTLQVMLVPEVLPQSAGLIALTRRT